ncbi:MAG: hypothetical protein IKW15_06245 [Bacteroidales bacterium]|nr:hypothetical protein [Bacteroidales bacterium]
MKIKGSDGQEYNVTGQGQGNFNTVGAAGGVGWIAEKLFGGNIFGSNNCAPCSENMPISRYDATMMQELAAKDARIGLLESNIYTDQKLADVYDRLLTKINANKEAQDAINMQQAVYNGTNTAALTCLQSQVAQLYSLTKLVVPNGSVCPGWGNVTISPATTTAG